MRAILAFLTAAITATACTGRHAQPSVHLTGANVRTFASQTDFTELSRELIQGTHTGDGCEFTVHVAGKTDDQPLAWQEVEHDVSTCQFVIARGHMQPSPPVTASAPHAATLKWRAGYKFVATSAPVFWVQNVLTWTFDGRVVRDGRHYISGGSYYPANVFAAPTFELRASDDSASYRSTARNEASVIFDSDTEWCTAPGTTHLTLAPAELAGDRAGRFTILVTARPSGPCKNSFFAYGEPGQ